MMGDRESPRQPADLGCGPQTLGECEARLRVHQFLVHGAEVREAVFDCATCGVLEARRQRLQVLEARAREA